MRATMNQAIEQANVKATANGKRARKIGVTAVALVALAACGSSADDATKFAGVWTFESGQLAATCGQAIPSPAPFQLAGLSVTLKRINNGSFDLIAGTAAKCTIHFSVSGNKATAPSNQTCILDVGDTGEQTLTVDTWTLELAGDRLTSKTTGLVLICSLNGSGVLVRGAPDGGLPPTDGGTDTKADGGTDTKADAGSDATAETGSDAAAETGADATAEAGTDAAAEAGSDAAAEAGSDAAAEAGSDAAAETGTDATDDAAGG
jgi:hypothetical protein